MKNTKNYKEYVTQYKFPVGISGDTVLDDAFSLGGIIKFNETGKLDLTMEQLFEVDPRVALHLFLGMLGDMNAIASEEVALVLRDAFNEAIDFSNGGLTSWGRARYAWDGGWLKAQAAMHRNFIQFEKIKHDPQAVKAWPKGSVANLGGPHTTKINQNTSHTQA